MKLGVHTFIWSATFDRSTFPLLARIKALGFDGVEFPLFRPAEFPAADVRKALEVNGLEGTACSILVDGLSLISDDADLRRRAIGYVRDVVKATAEVGAKKIAGPLFSPVGYLTGRRRTDDEWKRAVESHQAIAETLESHGVELAIEPLNRFETYFLNTAADAARLADEINHPNVGILIDTFHANIEEKSIGRALKTVGRHLKHVHACEHDRGTPGSGHFEWDELFRTLRELDYRGWLTIESFGFSLGELSSAVCIWRDIEATPESIAVDGVKFLRQRLA